MAPPVLGPCVAWCSADDVLQCCSAAQGGSDTSTTLGSLDVFAVSASMILFELSGRRFNGVCSETVRPCRGGCTCWEFTNPGAYWGAWWPGGPQAWGWGSGEDSCRERACGCAALSTVRLGYPVNEIVEVKIDGAVVDPATYRVDEWRELVRLADTAFTPPQPRFWPSCQDLMVDDTQPGSFSVTYTRGIAPPPLGMQAAAQLACQLYLSCNGGDCALPSGVTRITRQGITIERGLLASWFRETRFGQGWATGLPILDAFLTAYNPNALTRAPAVFTPDNPRFPRHAGT